MEIFINDLKRSDAWKIQLVIATNFTSSNYTDEEHVMHSKSDSTEIMINEKAYAVIEKCFWSLFSRYQIGLETLMKSIDFIFNCVQLLYYKCIKETRIVMDQI